MGACLAVFRDFQPNQLVFMLSQGRRDSSNILRAVFLRSLGPCRKCYARSCDSFIHIGFACEWNFRDYISIGRVVGAKGFAGISINPLAINPHLECFHGISGSIHWERRCLPELPGLLCA
jgi:hypothetical protein